MKTLSGRDGRRVAAFVAFALATSVVLYPTLAGERKTTHRWSYSGTEGPGKWGTLDPSYAACSAGRMQSPIDIRGAKRAELPALKFDYKAVPLSIIDNGHTIQVSYPAGSTLIVGTHVYALQQFHFHVPSEEKVNGRHFDMVVHLVHVDSAGHLVVVAVFLTRGQSNSLLHSLWQNLPEGKGRTKTASAVVINAIDILPTDRAYYTFSGSLTTPPCSEGVTWYVMKTPITLSQEQLATFKHLYPLNARPTQPANGREILDSQ